MRSFAYLLTACLAVISIAACEQELPDDPIPVVLVNEQLSLNSLANDNLNVIGGTVTIPNAGVKGIIVYRASLNEYRAFDQACSFAPSQECEKVHVDDSNLFMIDTCCNSRFDFFGFPNSGPASWPLREYSTFVTGSTLVIRNQ